MKMRWSGHVARLEAMKVAYKVWFGLRQRSRPLGISRRRWQDNIKMDRREMRWEAISGLGLCEHGAVPSGSIKVHSFWTGFLVRTD
jgi:hypothetical protein